MTMRHARCFSVFVVLLATAVSASADERPERPALHFALDAVGDYRAGSSRAEFVVTIRNVSSRAVRFQFMDTNGSWMGLVKSLRYYYTDWDPRHALPSEALPVGTRSF